VREKIADLHGASGLRVVRSFRVPPAPGGQIANHDNAEIRRGKSEFSPAFERFHCTDLPWSIDLASVR
jgi:hypothetical protein